MSKDPRAMTSGSGIEAEDPSQQKSNKKQSGGGAQTDRPTSIKIVSLGQQTIVGMAENVTDAKDIRNVWSQTFPKIVPVLTPLAKDKEDFYGVSYIQEKEHSYLAGMNVANREGLPADYEHRVIPAGTYACFEGPFHAWWTKSGAGWVHETWLPTSGYVHDPRGKVSEFIIHGKKDWVRYFLPVRKKGGAMTKQSVTRDENGRVVVQNVEALEGSNTTLASLTPVLRAMGEDVTYAYLMGVSSRAFRLQFSWCASCPHSYIGFNTYRPALRAMGYESTNLPGTFHDGEPQRKVTAEDLEKTRAAVRAAIDAGHPCIFGSEEDSVLVGYEPISPKNPTGWLRRPGPIPPAGKNAPYLQPIKHMPWGVNIIRKTEVSAPSRRESILWSLRTAVRNAKRGDFNGLAIGFAAWDKWIQELPKTQEIIEKTRKELEAKGRGKESASFAIQLGNAWCYESLWDARGAAVTYLRSIKDTFGPAAEEHLSRAADEYEQLVLRLVENADCFTSVAPYPFMKHKPWTEAVRADQLERLKKALIHEKNAIAEIEKALTVLNDQVSDSSPESQLTGLLPRFVELPSFRVLGVEDDWARLEKEDPGYSNIWFRRYMPQNDNIAPHSPDNVHYGVVFMDPQTGKQDRYLAGMAVKGNPPLPAGDNWVLRTIPATRYAVFDTTVRDVGDTWNMVLQKWLPQSGYHIDPRGVYLDHHPADTKGQESPMTIWLPLTVLSEQSKKKDGEMQLLTLSSFWVLGLQERFDEEHEDHKGLWDRYMKHDKEVVPLRQGKSYYEAYFDTESNQKHALDCLAGVKVGEGTKVPEGLTLRKVGASQFAVFGCTIAKIPQTWDYIHHRWLPASDYVSNPESVCFDEYLPAMQDGVNVRLYIPVQPKQKTLTK